MTTSSKGNDTTISEEKRRRMEARLDQIGRELRDLREQTLRTRIRLEILDELERQRRPVGLFRRF